MQNAFGPLNLKPDEFWELTLAEYNMLVEGYKWRQNEEWRRIAQLAVWVSEKLKPETTPNDLLGIKRPVDKTTPEETEMFFDQMENEFEKAKKKVS